MIRGYFSAWKFCRWFGIKPQELDLKWPKIGHGSPVDENGKMINSPWDLSSRPVWETKRKPKTFEHFTPIKKGK